MSVAHTTIRKHGDISGLGSNRDHIAVQMLYRTGPAPPWLPHTGAVERWPHLSPAVALGRLGSLPCQENTVELVC